MTLRAFIISIILVIASCLIMAVTDHAPQLVLLTGANHLPMIVVFVLVLFALVINPVLKKLNPESVFNTSELVVIWSVLAAAVGIPAFGLTHYMLPYLVAPFYYQGADGKWAKAFYEYIPEWLVPSTDTTSPVVTKFFEGVGANEHVTWELMSAWVTPFIMWSIAIGAFFLMVFCITAILRKQWVEHERLSFPLAQVPLEIMRPAGEGRLLNDLFRSPLMWIGAAIPIFFWGLQLAHRHYAWMPIMGDTNWQLTGLFGQMTGWRGRLTLDFLAVGVTFLLTTEVSFSLWFFFVAFNFQHIFRTQYGYADAGYKVHQQVGGFLAFSGIMLWTMRHHLKDVFRKAFFDAQDVDDSDNGLSYRFAVIGLIVSMLVIMSWLYWGFGCPWHISLMYILAGIVVLLVLSRFIAQCGLVLVQTSLPSGPLSVVQTFVGDKAITPGGLTGITFNQVPMYGDPREIMMPSLLNNTKVAERRANLKKLFGAMMLAVFIAWPVAYFSQVYKYYDAGQVPDGWAVDGYPKASLNRLADAIDDPQDAFGDETSFIKWEGTRHMFYGGGLFLLISLLRARFYWWFLHPVGILTAQTYPLEALWASIFLGWLFKSLAQKYARGEMMGKIKFLFLGMIIGDVFIKMLMAVDQLIWPT